MNFVGIDLHKKSISVCVVDQNRQVPDRERFSCTDGKGIEEFFELLNPFQAVIEATAGCEWSFKLLEPLAEEVVLAHPQKLRISLHLGLGECAGEGTTRFAGIG